MAAFELRSTPVAVAEKSAVPAAAARQAQVKDVEAPPGPWVGSTRAIRTMPLTFDETNAENWEPEEDMALLATEVKVNYFGGYTLKRDETLETHIGRVTRSISCPFLAWARCAAYATEIGLAMLSQALTMSFSPRQPMLGMIAQLYDRVQCQPPGGTLRTYRIINKQISFPGECRLTCVREGHWDSILDKSTFTTWGAGTWGAGEMF